MEEGNVLYNDTLNTFYIRLYGVKHMVKDHSGSERRNPLPPHTRIANIHVIVLSFIIYVTGLGWVNTYVSHLYIQHHLYIMAITIICKCSNNRTFLKSYYVCKIILWKEIYIGISPVCQSTSFIEHIL